MSSSSERVARGESYERVGRDSFYPDDSNRVSNSFQLVVGSDIVDSIIRSANKVFDAHEYSQTFNDSVPHELYEHVRFLNPKITTITIGFGFSCGNKFYLRVLPPSPTSVLTNFLSPELKSEMPASFIVYDKDKNERTFVKQESDFDSVVYTAETSVEERSVNPF